MKTDMQNSEFNVYCDESCHLEHDRQSVMVLGNAWCNKIDVKRISRDIRALKKEYHAEGEMKWNKISKSREAFFLKIVDYFFDENSLFFRCLIVENKHLLNHEYFNQGSHDSFYYKMYYYLIRNILNNNLDNSFNVYIDIKDTRSVNKIHILKEYLCNNFRDFEGNLIGNIQHINSRESELLQLSDIFIGAISYYNRNLNSNSAKNNIVDSIKRLSGLDLKKSNPPWDKKFNIFNFSPQSKKAGE